MKTCSVCSTPLGWDRPSGVCSEVCLRHGQGFALTWPERVELAVRQWPQWSRKERERMDDVVAEVMAHIRSGCGNLFIRSWCDRFMLPCDAAV